MLEKIKNIANITTGIYSRTHSSGEVYYIQARNFNQYRKLKNDLEPNILWDGNTENHFLNTGDVLIAAKGFDHFAAIYMAEVNPAVASSMFIVLRNIDKNKVLPDFICWYFNHPNTQAFLNSMAKGTNLPSISKKNIEEIELELPNLDKQYLILKVSELRIKERQLKDEIEALREIMINQQLINALK